MGRLWETLGEKRPCYTLVEPIPAACGFESAKAGKPVVVKGDLETLMAGLAVGLDDKSRVLVYGTEGDTDPEMYEKIVGRSAEAVRAGGK